MTIYFFKKISNTLKKEFNRKVEYKILQREKNPALYLYFDFLKSEIPNLLQIIGIPTLFGLFLRFKIIALFVITLLISILLENYLIQAFYKYLNTQITDRHSYVNRKKIDEKNLFNKWENYILKTSIILSLIAFLITFFIIYA